MKRHGQSVSDTTTSTTLPSEVVEEFHKRFDGIALLAALEARQHDPRGFIDLSALAERPPTGPRRKRRGGCLLYIPHVHAQSPNFSLESWQRHCLGKAGQRELDDALLSPLMEHLTSEIIFGRDKAVRHEMDELEAEADREIAECFGAPPKEAPESLLERLKRWNASLPPPKKTTPNYFAHVEAKSEEDPDFSLYPPKDYSEKEPADAKPKE